MRHTRSETPAYLIWVEARPTHRGKGRAAYYGAVKQAAHQVIATPITACDIELEVAYSTRTKQATRLDADNVNKPTLDALKGVAYADDSQVRSVRCTVFDRSTATKVNGRVEQMGRLFYSPNDHVVLIMVYSDSRLAELGGEKEVQRRRYEEWQREFDSTMASMRKVHG
jgi:Holliday junction resolvase RusA-like endonuclease